MNAATSKKYECDRCKHVVQQTTNHYGPTWSYERVGVCPICPPWAKYPEFGGQTTWSLVSQPPAGEDTGGSTELS